MERFKQFILQHFEKILVGLILLAAFIGTYFVEEKFIVLNFYYLPVLVASYFLGLRMGVLASVFSILAVLLCALIFPQRYLGSQEIWHGFALVSCWAGFLILASIAVGTLYEVNERRLLDLKNAYISILEILSKYIESVDQYTKGHSLRVAELAMEIAITSGLHRADVETIRVAGLLHEIGKIEISGDMLRMAAELSMEERELIDTHAAKGAHLLASVGSVLKEVVPIVDAYHKYFMSTIEGESKVLPEVPLGTRIIAVADAFDVMTTDRRYRKGIQPWEALKEISVKAGKEFDPGVVEAFKRVINEKMEMV